jgi:iron complex outermembrane recepter protein
MIKKVSLLSLSLVLCLLSFAQKQQYVIKVLDAAGKAISSASVKIKGSTSGASADFSGSAYLSASAGQKIEVSSVGYATQELTLGSNATVEVVLVALSEDLSDVVVIGSRSAARAKTNTAVPVDVIKVASALQPTGRMDFTSLLNTAAPSFNYNKQSGSDGADHVDLGSLRGLGPDQTLVLINGKRRHSSALLMLYGTRGKGTTGTDLNAITTNAIDRVEILRDGASAQYGSDAIAGVMNLVLSKQVNKWTVNIGQAAYNDTKFNSNLFNDNNDYYTESGKLDGRAFNINIANGFKVGKSGGFVSVAANYLTQGKTFRQVRADTTLYKKDRYVMPFVNNTRRAFGDGSIESGSITFNSEFPVRGTNLVIYAFGGSTNRNSEAYAYSRNGSAGTTSGNERFPISNTGSIIFVPEIMRLTNDGTIYYNPIIKTEINDASIATGIKGKSKKDWNWDLSLVVGKNDFQYFGDKTFNASLIGNTTKNFFVDGGYRFRQQTLNYDVNKNFKKVLHGLNIAYGFEQRSEKYTINKGERASYENYDPTRVQFGGAQGFNGIAPADEVNATRYAIASYADAELKLDETFLFDGALRFENYSDFGSVLTYKLAGAAKLSNNFTFRASGSTGFRAPSLAQLNFQQTSTSFSGSTLVESLIARNTGPVAQAAGIAALKQERSTSYSVGFAAKSADGALTVTVDGYQTKIKDRIVLSGLFNASDATLPNSLTSYMQARNITTAQFIANAVNTTNYGVDVVADYKKAFGSNNMFRATFAANFQKMTIDQINVPSRLATTGLNRKTFFSDRDEAYLKASAPNQKANLALSYTKGWFTIGTNFTYWGSLELKGFGFPTAANPNVTGIFPQVPRDNNPNILIDEIYDIRAKVTSDFNMSFKFSKNVTWIVGVDNAFNVHPDLSINQAAKSTWFSGNETGGPFDAVQMGYNGRRLFTKLAINF